MRQGALTKFNQKKALWISPKHPLYFEDNKFKLYYSAGILLHVRLNTNNSLSNFEFERLLTKGFSLNSKDILIVMKLSNSVQSTVDTLLEKLTTPFYRCLFLMDLMNVSICGRHSISKAEDKSIQLFSKLLEIDSSTQDLLFQFISSSHFNNYDTCLQLLKAVNYLQLGFSISDLSYYMLDYPFTTQISQNSLIQEDIHRFHSNCEIKEPIFISSGSILEFSNAIVHIYNPIKVNGGKLVIKNSHFIFHSCFENKKNDPLAFFQVDQQGSVAFSYSSFDCQNNGFLIEQVGGSLLVSSCNIENTRGNSSISFDGEQFNIENCLFKNCITNQNGGAINIQEGCGFIKNCIFTECEARLGGAIFSTNKTMILDCHFQSCRTTSYGSAIYYHGEIRSNISNCQCSLCIPSGDEIIQYITTPETTGRKEEIIIQKETQFSYSAILDCPLKITELGILELHDITLYISVPIHCYGILHMKNVKVIARNPSARDLFILETTRHCNISYCEFDGLSQCGIFHVKHGRLHISHCFFYNIANGRAIYNAFAPVIDHCIFSFCSNGAIYCKSGKITNCFFINCRGKNGSGIQMYGNRGEIETCKFVRCISETTKDAIDITGSYHIRNCTYEECNPK